MRVKIDPSLILMAFQTPGSGPYDALLKLFVLYNEEGRFPILELCLDSDGNILNAYRHAVSSSTPRGGQIAFKRWLADLSLRSVKHEFRLDSSLYSDSRFSACHNHEKALIALAMVEQEKDQKAIIADECTGMVSQPRYYQEAVAKALESPDVGIVIHGLDTAKHLLARGVSSENAVGGVGQTDVIGTLPSKLSSYFSKEEVRDLALQLGVDPENLENKTKRQLARELVQAVKRRGLVSKLIELCQKERSNVSWP